MFYPAPVRPKHYIANFGGALLVGLFFAMLGLNAASGCGEAHGQCIKVSDFFGQPVQMASR